MFGSSGNGSICVGVYSFDPTEELQSCCTCLVTPDGLVSLSAKAINATNLTGEAPHVAGDQAAGLVHHRRRIVHVCYLGTPAPPTSSACNASNPGLHTSGLQAWGTTLHPLPVSGYTTTETPFSIGTLSPAELAHVATTCAFNQINGSGTFGQCPGCTVGGAVRPARQ